MVCELPLFAFRVSYFLVRLLTHALIRTIFFHRGVPSEKLGDVLALAGDAADNIPGVRPSVNSIVSFAFQYNLFPTAYIL